MAANSEMDPITWSKSGHSQLWVLWVFRMVSMQAILGISFLRNLHLQRPV